MDGGYGEETREREADDNAVIVTINIQTAVRMKNNPHGGFFKNH